MKTTTQNTLKTISARELEAQEVQARKALAKELAMEKNPWDAIDSDEIVAQIAKPVYGVEYKGINWMIDELNDEAVNTQTGEKCDIATFMHAYRKYTAKDNTFSAQAELLEGDELEDIVSQLQEVEYISEIVTTKATSNTNDEITTESKIFIFTDSEDESFMIRQELTKTSEGGADLLAFSEPRVYLYKGICNSMLYYTEDASTVLHYLGFKDLIGGTWYHPTKGITANIGEYNFFKKAQPKARVSTKTAKAFATLSAM